MAGSKSDYLEGKVLDHVLGGTTYSAPATVYIALFTSAPTETSGGVEVTGGGYARAAVTNNTSNWPAAIAGVKKNGTRISFPTATGAWGTILGSAIFDAPTGGNMLWWASISNISVVEGDTASFPANSITITED